MLVLINLIVSSVTLVTVVYSIFRKPKNRFEKSEEWRPVGRNLSSVVRTLETSTIEKRREAIAATADSPEMREAKKQSQKYTGGCIPPNPAAQYDPNWRNRKE